MPEANGIRASLICEGSPLTEYPYSSSAPCTAWCESSPGQTFVVELNGPIATSDYSIMLYCDGVFMKSYAIPCHTSLSSTFQGLYLPEDGTKLLPFTFANIELCEEVDSHPDQIVKNLGTVSVELFYCNFGNIRPNTNTSLPTVASTIKFSERDMRTSMIPHIIRSATPPTDFDHQVTLFRHLELADSNLDRSLGESTTAPRLRSTVTWEVHQVDPIPCLRFVWQYRPRDFLITAGVIPRDVSDHPTPPVTHKNNEARSVQVSEPRVKERCGINAGGDMVPGPSSNTNQSEVKPEVKLQKSGSKPVVIDIRNDQETSVFFSNPNLLAENEDDDPRNSSSENFTQASSSSTHQIQVKPVNIKLKTAGGGQPNQTKRVQAETEVEENDRKRVKLKMRSATLYDSDETLQDEDSL
ncbi:uncharacterized protein MELLADRAFT_61748 [Melampsora larici-populina 98AG31]|uniref:DUF7918 domain-containing protein n=1 Tax=Melampsora larici-populina (strain 98AG31 / pathotype 3-4-7) TaxID=747676 RepID=F4RFZ8_MELLP|nr:uncharacterized protein MELLADRAFT_61748 [Melampsora larici-populina 98AG31]EGG08463.1 hypothetical protein MELLADRAFT_61748 [Melampsora larici-populina 98AG31]